MPLEVLYLVFSKAKQMSLNRKAALDVRLIRENEWRGYTVLKAEAEVDD